MNIWGFRSLVKKLFESFRISAPLVRGGGDITIYGKEGVGGVIELDYDLRQVKVSYKEHYHEAKLLVEQCEEMTGREFILKTTYERID